MKKPSRITDHYILVYSPNHTRSVGGGYVPEHILEAEKVLGRNLTPDEDVRHINGNPHDNRPANLEIYSVNSGYKTQAVDSESSTGPRKVSSKTFVACRYQKPCWKTIRAPIARQNGVYLPYICSFQQEGDIYKCSRWWKFFEEETKENEKQGESKEGV